MIAAVVALALVLAALAAALVWLVREARNEGRLANAAAKSEASVRFELLEVGKQRDAALVEVAQAKDAEAVAVARIGTLEVALTVLRKELLHARVSRVVDAAPGDVGAAVDRVLAERVIAEAGGADDRGAAASTGLSGPGSTASDGRTLGLSAR